MNLPEKGAYLAAACRDLYAARARLKEAAEAADRARDALLYIVGDGCGHHYADGWGWVTVEKKTRVLIDREELRRYFPAAWRAVRHEAAYTSVALDPVEKGGDVCRV